MLPLLAGLVPSRISIRTTKINAKDEVIGIQQAGSTISLMKNELLAIKIFPAYSTNSKIYLDVPTISSL
jgi:hypothetical protein